jgi:AAA+ ATPase superfamily predicted ATPase
MFDRDVEWMELAAFTDDDRPGASLGIVSGRRRQGKTFLLRALCEATGGFYFAADEATDGDSLHQIGAALGEHLGLTSGLRFESWHEVFDALLALGNEQPVTVVIDEFPYLARANQSLPSILQNALAPRRAQREGSRTRLLLCGSAMTFMGTLLAGNAPLRGRAGLELVVPTLDYQLAAQFWNVTDPVLAIKVHAIVGGTPAYRREFARDDSPADADDFDGWVLRTVLNRASPLFREARYLLAAETELQDLGLYHSVLAAIADGNATSGGIAGYIGRKSSDLAHPLNVLIDCGLVHRQPDAFRANRSTYEIAEPLITFYHGVMRPIWSDLAHTRNPARLWERSEPRFISNVLGPHFEQLCRHWTRYFAPQEITGGFPSRVEPGTVNDPGSRKTRQIDIAALAVGDDGREAILAIGEAKWHETMSLAHLERLRRIRGLLMAQGRLGAERARLLCFSGAGFTEELRDEAARSGEVGLLTPADLYAGILLPEPGHPCRLVSHRDILGASWLSLLKRLQGQLVGDHPVVAGRTGRSGIGQGVACSAGRAADQVEQRVLLAVDPDLGQFQHVAGRCALPP